ncbi:MAG: (Fe-S)-binding protein [Deltaproteobacteria bacterium]|nr:(Fe-S)-binding protein [Deltaproteobacteria bacterium]
MSHREAVLKSIQACDSVKALKLYMETCAKCGTCAEVCPIYFGRPEQKYNPAFRSDVIRRIYKKHHTVAGKLLGPLVGAADLREEDLPAWVDHFYSCSGCRRCATYCPFGIDNSVITRKGRALLDSIGLTPKRLKDVINISLKTGNTDGAPPVALTEAVNFLQEEMQEETGQDVKIPVDQVGAEMFFVPPSGDVLVNPEAIMGIAKVLHKLGVSWTMSTNYFDGANYGLFTGDDKAMKDDNKAYVEEAKRLQCKTMLMGECGHAYRVMKFMMEKARWWGELPFTITNVMLYTAAKVRDGAIKLDKDRNPDAVTYHDPCNFGRSCGITEEPRQIMRAACRDYREMTPGGAENWCCGGGGGLSAMDEIKEFRMTVSGVKKVEQIRQTGAKFVAAPCSNCKRQIQQLTEHHRLDVKIGGLHDVVSNAIVL